MIELMDNSESEVLHGPAVIVPSAELTAAMQRIVARTHQLVELAANANWDAVLDGMDERRCVLQNLMETYGIDAHPQLAALNAAVAESERALMRVIAHAIASAQMLGAQFAMYH